MSKKYRLKLCCHKTDYPMCEFIELPFQPKNGDIIIPMPSEFRKLVPVVFDNIGTL